MPRTMFIDKKRKHLVLFQPLIEQESSFILLLAYTHTHTRIRTHTHVDIYLLHSSGFRGLETFLLLAEITHTQILWTKYCRWPLVNIIFNFSNNVVIDDTKNIFVRWLSNGKYFSSLKNTYINAVYECWATCFQFPLFTAVWLVCDSRVKGWVWSNGQLNCPVDLILTQYNPALWTWTHTDDTQVTLDTTVLADRAWLQVQQ